jgi:hypothetical protein
LTGAGRRRQVPAIDFQGAQAMADEWVFPKGELMAGKRGLVMGVANDKSIAWGIASQLAAQGAELAFTYQGEALEKRVRPLVESIGAKIMLECDATNDAQLDAVRRNTDLVTVQIGGNDIGFGSIISTCARLGAQQPTGDPCRRHYASSGTDQLTLDIARTAPKVDRVLRLRGKGLPAGKGHGDLLVTLRIRLPEADSRLRQFAEALRESGSYKPRGPEFG